MLNTNHVTAVQTAPPHRAQAHFEALNLPHGRIVERDLAEHDPSTLFVVYCPVPHCNAADKPAVRLPRLGRPVKKMIGGVEGWKDEGFSLTS